MTILSPDSRVIQREFYNQTNLTMFSDLASHMYGGAAAGRGLYAGPMASGPLIHGGQIPSPSPYVTPPHLPLLVGPGTTNRPEHMPGKHCHPPLWVNYIMDNFYTGNTDA